jgi:hypothetical protein
VLTELSVSPLYVSNNKSLFYSSPSNGGSGNSLTNGGRKVTYASFPQSGRFL